MTLLGLSAAEIRQEVEAALASNPTLELVEERRCPTCNRRLAARGPCPVCSAPAAAEIDEPVVFVSTREDFHFGNGRPAEDLPDDNFAPTTQDLQTYVLRQIAPELDPEDQALAAHLLSCLDEDGLLSVPPMEVASYQHVPLFRVEEVIDQIQRANPIGVGSPSSRDALLIQLEILRETQPIPQGTEAVIREGIDLLSRKRYRQLARLLQLSPAEVHEIAQFISDNLNPFPARAHWGEVRQMAEPASPTYRTPDAILSLLNDRPEAPLVVEILIPLGGTLRVNRAFREAIRKAPPEMAAKWKADIEQAMLLVKCLRQRNHTMVRLMEWLATYQRPFILRGDAHLRPVTRAQIAAELEVHESTISRAVSSKAIQMPNGRIIPLKRFFDRSLPVRTAVKEIISAEQKPLSDNQIARKLKEMGHKVARRTVAKYRSMEGILPAHLRQPAPDLAGTPSQGT